MKTTDRQSKKPTRMTGVFATLSGLLHFTGTGAPEATHAAGTGAPADGGRPSEAGNTQAQASLTSTPSHQQPDAQQQIHQHGQFVHEQGEQVQTEQRAPAGRWWKSLHTSSLPKIRAKHSHVKKSQHREPGRAFKAGDLRVQPFASCRPPGTVNLPNLAPYRFLGLLAGLLVFAGMSASSAQASGVWWHLVSGSRPSVMHVNAVDGHEVQKVLLQQGHIQLIEPVGYAEKGYDVGVDAIELPFESSPAELQAALEGIYGANNVAVSGHVGHEATAVPDEYLITFVGGLAGARPRPLTDFEPEQEQVTIDDPMEIVVNAENLGDQIANGAVRLSDVLPAGLVPVGIVGGKSLGNQFSPASCSLQALSCSYSAGLAPYTEFEMRIDVVVEEGVGPGEVNRVSVSGGAGAPVSQERPLVFGGETPFGIEDYELLNEEEGGGPTRQAGAHPFQQTSVVDLNELGDTGLFSGPLAERPVMLPAGTAKDVSIHWPPGLLGNPTRFPHCSLAQFVTKAQVVENETERDECPASAAVGAASVTVNEVNNLGVLTFPVPLFNLEPAEGEPARFGFFVPAADVGVLIDPSLRSGEDYGITVTTNDITQTAAFMTAHVTVWGVPGDPRHANARGWACLSDLEGGGEGCAGGETETHPVPFLSMPTSCTAGLSSTVDGDTWKQADEELNAGLPEQLSLLASFPLPQLEGCDRLPFDPSIKVAPDVQEASKPSGLSVDVHVPQEVNNNASGLASAGVKGITVTLPAGVTLNPSAADGLQACSESQVGFEAHRGTNGFEEFESGVRTPVFTPYLPGSQAAQEAVAAHKAPASESILQPGENFCPDAAKIATVKIKTPLLANPLEGAVYLASPQNFHALPQENPFEALVAMYIVAEDRVSGSLVKIPGRVSLNQETGQITSVFEDNPQVTFEDAEIHFFGGERAPLATPNHCGAYTTDASFTPWSGGPPVTASSTFDITSGPNGGAGGTPCPSAALPFNATLASGTTNNNAGAFSDLTTTLSRPDGNQNIQSVVLHYPPGVSGMLKGVPLCPEAQANAGTCGSESQIGETIVSVGLGGDPFTVTGGKVYLTEKYAGAPFGLSIVNPAKAGPFDLQEGRPVVVRAKIEIDPVTAALTVTTNTPAQGHSIPSILEGFPLQIQHVNVLVNRPGFTFNPTNCDPLSLIGTVASGEGAASPVSVPFQVTNCAVLKYTPKLQVSTAAKASKTNGASLFFKIAYPKGAVGSESWMREMKFDIPKQLPARLTTIQKACLAATFEHNRAACPPASIIGHLVVHTPVLPVPLEGPLYFVSYGGAAFPDAVAVIKGYGITIESHGHTFINGKTGVTSATFESVPDVPFESIEVTVPQGPFSEFGANLPAKAKDDFCGQKLVMPIRFKAQNGLEITQNTPVGVTGCKTLTRKQKLATALKACRKKHGKKRASCEKAARRAYGAGAAKKAKKGRK